MLINPEVTVAFRCLECGRLTFDSTTPFKLVKEHGVMFPCECGRSTVTINITEKMQYSITVPCIACGEYHTYTLDKRIWREPLNILTCPKSGYKVCFLGKEQPVLRAIEDYDVELDKALMDLNFDDYFKNDEVMYEAINKLHEIAERGNLYCTCGNDNIDVLLKPEGIELLCKKCHARGFIYAGSIKDLRSIARLNTIVLNDPILCTNKRPEKEGG
ncbi:hypothetical protein [Calorimonas adulescens]|jgi:hypothetical protein|uniref:Uncharacterized protein n=1 Tax=Calorimonas adulescens TaxID=2606906 RepID=A0A5D8QDY7_9THEO|nr:hypothetical protein [Calorimonas adulescens]TZE82910.1 hypothetical protein FWJ32_02855 [Calorimonas adulescens]